MSGQVGCISHPNLLQFPSLVPAVGQTRVAVLPLSIDIDLAPQSLRDAGEMLDRRRPKGQDLSGDAGERLGEVKSGILGSHIF